MPIAWLPDLWIQELPKGRGKSRPTREQFPKLEGFPMRSPFPGDLDKRGDRREAIGLGAKGQNSLGSLEEGSEIILPCGQSWILKGEQDHK